MHFLENKMFLKIFLLNKLKISHRKRNSILFSYQLKGTVHIEKHKGHMVILISYKKYHNLKDS